jgi:signal transduction histidine kinase
VGRELADALGHEPLFHLEGPLDTELPAALRPHILAVVREALTNVARHAKPTQAVVTVELKGNRLDVIIEDHGKGPVDKQPGGRGLLNMAERARSLSGEMQLSPKPSGGSRLQWRHSSLSLTLGCQVRPQVSPVRPRHAAQPHGRPCASRASM